VRIFQVTLKLSKDLIGIYMAR